MTYKKDKDLFREGQYIRLFRDGFVEKNHFLCRIIISGKQHETLSVINIKQFKKYGLNIKNENIEVILKWKKMLMQCTYSVDIKI